MSDIRKYLRGIDGVTGVSKTVRRAHHLLGVGEQQQAQQTAAIAPAKKSTVTDFLRDIAATRPAVEIKDGGRTVVGGLAGGVIAAKYLPGNHYLLGAAGGASLGRNLPALLSKETRKAALGNLLTTGTAITGSLVLKNNRFVGFVLGWLAGGAGAYFGGLE